MNRIQINEKFAIDVVEPMLNDKRTKYIPVVWDGAYWCCFGKGRVAKSFHTEAKAREFITRKQEEI